MANDYPVSAIPDALLKNADVVKRFESVKLEVTGLNETILKKKYVLTVLNAAGAGYAIFQEDFDRLRTIKSVEGRLLDANGKEIRTARNKDIKDLSAISDISIYEDNRVKQHSFEYHQYPYTVEYEVEIRTSHTFHFRPWIPQDATRLSVEHSQFTLVTQPGYQVRTRGFNYPGTPQTTTDGGKRVVQWEVRNKPVITRPYAAPPWYELTTALYLAPTDFAVGGVEGNMNTWKELGKFQLLLLHGRDQLPAPVKQQVSEIAARATTKRERVQQLYAFMQQHTRYVSVQLGIGGWQPFEAAYVVKNRYGDCKALSNYMYSLLKEAGITAHYALIKAGNTRDDRRMIEDFPMLQFNHAVLCVPLEKDTMWLECTDQKVPAGYMGSFTGNRKALLMTTEGGVLANTPSYGVAENLQIRKIEGSLDAAGNLTVQVKTRYTGIRQDGKEEVAATANTQQVKEALNARFDLPSYEVTGFKYEPYRKELPELDETLNLTLPRYATLSGRRLFLLPNLLGQSTLKLAYDSARNTDYLFDIAYRDVDSVDLQVPAGYTPETKPADVQLQTKFGKYSFTVKVQDNRVFMLRTIEQFAVRVAPSEAKEMIAFWDAVYKTDRSRVVLLRKE